MESCGSVLKRMVPQLIVSKQKLRQTDGRSRDGRYVRHEQKGKEYRRLVSAFKRIFGATIFFGTDQRRGTAKVVHRSRFNFLQETRIWYSRDPEQSTLSGDFENAIVLSDEFYGEIASHSIPTDLEAVPMGSDAYARIGLMMLIGLAEERAFGVEHNELNVRCGIDRWWTGRDYRSNHECADAR
ncbi:MAG: hypothetical protein WA324_23330 [Bryobacteraceae bacterium]